MQLKLYLEELINTVYFLSLFSVDIRGFLKGLGQSFSLFFC